MPSRLIKALAAVPRLPVCALKAWVTLEPADWAKLAQQWAAVAAAFPASLAVARAEARLSRAGRDPERAIAAGLRALALAPGHRQVLLELGRARRQAGQRDEAIADLAAAAVAGSSMAKAELRRYGARRWLPEQEQGIFPREDPAWLASAAPPAPVPRKTPRFRVALAGTAEEQLATRETLAAQAYRNWGEGEAETEDDWVISLPAGARLDRHALGWLAWAAAESDAASIRTDHCLHSPDGQRHSPALLPAFDPLWVDRPGGLVRLCARRNDGNAATIHLPLVLMSLPEGAAGAVPLAADAEPEPLSVIIPSRDNPVLLEAAVSTLMATTAHPERVELVIVDNGSRTPAAGELLRRLAERPNTVIVPFAEPFNWSRANNLGARVASGTNLLFLNDDTVMQTPGWDRILAGLLARDDVGVVGSRMVYPDGRIQHAGFVLGMDNGPQHEGRWMAGDDEGPGSRWIATRAAAAVTGAFMAIRRDQFTTVGGFDEETFAVDFADLDLCLKLRQRGGLVAYCGAITLTHHESISRGLNLGRAKRRRMARERAAFEQRWGAMASHDPYYHPAWVRTGCSYDGLRALSSEQAQTHCKDGLQVRRPVGQASVRCPRAVLSRLSADADRAQYAPQN